MIELKTTYKRIYSLTIDGGCRLPSVKTLILFFCFTCLSIQAQRQPQKTTITEAPTSTQPLPAYLQGRPLTNVSGIVVNRYANGNLIVSNLISVTVKVQTGGGIYKRANGTIGSAPATYSDRQQAVAHLVTFRNYPLASQVNIGDSVKSTGILYSSGGGVEVIDYYKPPTKGVKVFK